jgi:hypothetical protein
MSGRTKDFTRNRQNQVFGSLDRLSADFLFSKLKYLIHQINFSFALIELNRSKSSYIGVMMTTDEELALGQLISEFIGILFYMESKHKNLLLPYRDNIFQLKVKLGLIFP